MALSLADFDRLVADHAAPLYRMAYRLLGDRFEAEDAVQDTFRSAWNSRERFDPLRGERVWLATILRRRVADRWRRRRLPSVTAGDRLIEVAAPAVHPGAQEYTDETQQALDRLPAELRETLLLVVVGELTHQETAHLLGIPLGTVLSRVARARKRLREFLRAAPGDADEPPRLRVRRDAGAG